MKILHEAQKKAYMSSREVKLKKELIKIVAFDGVSKHGMYAERLRDFDINIVSYKADPNCTASISYDEGIIYVGEGFLVDGIDREGEAFKQLGVVMRHELAHNMLMHQLRMTRHLGKEKYERLARSSSFHKIINIIADDEISNKKYNVHDKEIMRNLKLGHRYITCLVTEDHRQGWLNLTLEEMYEKVCEEIKEIQQNIIKNNTANFKNADFVTRNLIAAISYSDLRSAPSFNISLSKLAKNKFKITYQGKTVKMANNFVNILKELHEYVSKELPDTATIENLMEKIAYSEITDDVDLLNNGKIMLLTNEEKSLAVDVLKVCLTDIQKNKTMVQKVCSDNNVSSQDIQDILDELAAKGVKI